MVEAFRQGGGEGKPMYLKVQLSYAQDEEQALQGAYDQWRTNIFKSPVLSDSRLPKQFDAAAEFVKPEDMYEYVRISDEPEQLIEWLQKDLELGFSLITMADWLIECRVDTVAMEATGVYWIPVFQILEARGLEVKLVNAHHVKIVPGRKTDVNDFQWLQQLHTYGLLSGSFRPEDQVCVLRSYIRQRGSLIKSAGIHVQRMQKALIQMNLHLHKVISDITGHTGIAIIKAIVAGERNPQVLAALKDPRI